MDGFYGGEYGIANGMSIASRMRLNARSDLGMQL
jgi:hypothetical protein